MADTTATPEVGRDCRCTDHEVHELQRLVAAGHDQLEVSRVLWGRPHTISRALLVDHFGHETRRLVRAGYAADLVLLDPDTVQDTATFEDPRQQATGIDLVLVDGVAVIDDGVRTDALPGRALRRTGRGTR